MHEIDHTHDPERRSWVESANEPGTDFPIQNLPFGVFRTDDDEDDEARVGVAIGDRVLDLAACCEEGLFEEIEEDNDDEDNSLEEDLSSPMLGLLLASGPELWSALRHRVGELLEEGNEEIAGNKGLRSRLLLPMDDVEMQAPDAVTDYTDFYASLHHATNVGSMFRPDNPLLPNYKWIPIGYHGRSSTIVASGTPVRRPWGQTCAEPGATPPAFGPCRMLDYELEVGFFVGQGNEMGDRLHIDRVEEHIFGICLVNDWSARDLQKWEYQPLGPFLAKSFATSVSPWVVTLEALAPFRCPAFTRPDGDPAPMEHLDGDFNRDHGGIDLTVEAHLLTEAMRERGAAPVRLSTGRFADLYWTLAQMLTHHASNGCAMEPGDLIASGTVSGPARENRGCLLELTWNGDPWAPEPRVVPGSDRTPIELPTGETRTFLEDGDEVILTGFCEREGYRRIGLGECRGVVRPAR